jgi:hypothetical protein
MGRRTGHAIVCILVLIACILSAGCSGLAATEGPLTKYLLSSRASPVPSATPALSPVATPTEIIILQPTGSQEIPATPAEDLSVYNPLRVIPQADDTVEYLTYTFSYRADNYTVKIPVNTSVLRAANTSSNKQKVIDDKEIRPFYQQMTGDTAMESFYIDIISEIRKLRYRGGNRLTDDEYLEMIVSFVQQIPYDNSTTGGPRYPVEVIFNQKGDSADKSVLLTGMLSREGYDVALLIFPQQKHVTAGIRIYLATNRPLLRVFSDGKRDYIYIETTTTRLIGFYPDIYETALRPVIVPVGSGTLVYGKVGYIMNIFYDTKTIEKNMNDLHQKALAGQALPSWDQEAYNSYFNTYNFVMSTNDRVAAMEAIRESELPHHTACMSCD